MMQNDPGYPATADANRLPAGAFQQNLKTPGRGLPDELGDEPLPELP